MSKESCILTTKDLTILEVMLDRCHGASHHLGPLLRRKINSAVVMFRDDVPEGVATLSSRVTFRVDDQEADTRIISHDRMSSPVGMFLPITSRRGLALLGLSEEQEIRLLDCDGKHEVIRLERVLYQPEAARRAREIRSADLPGYGKPPLRVIEGSGPARAPRSMAKADGFDDPGPSAA
jgi:regulator of nucleoside diphosphate kinase